MDTPLRLRHWLHGVGKLRGFGIQSPWAYDFVRHVVAERSPYYKYTELQAATGVSRKEEKVCRLLFRVANFCQPATVYIARSLPAAYADYVHGGCNRARPAENPQTARLTLLPIDSPHVEQAAQSLAEGDALLLFGINTSLAAHQQWLATIARPRCTTTFELWQAGIIFHKKSFQQQHYILNF